jgi:hypothetical protein
MIHVIPLNDKIIHTADCECCKAFLDPDGIWIHHAADKREQYERQGKNGKPWQLCAEDDATGLLVPIDG